MNIANALTVIITYAILTPMHPTTADLKREYHQAHLWRAGVSLQKAVSDPLIRLGLELAARAHSKPQQPKQLNLI